MTAKLPELLAPAGNWDCVRAAVANGADAVYFGLPQFNARLRADNFTLEELPTLVAFLHQHRVRAYIALNTLIFTHELAEAEQFLLALQAAEVDAIIVQDLGLVQLARRVAPDVQIHASTQMTITSPEGARWAQGLGVTRVVLARETSLRELERFQHPDLPPTEVFVHGALCVAYSGQCLTSESLGQRSANRGECAQACRLPYELVVDGILQDLGDRRYLLSPQDLAAVAEIPRLVQLGVSSCKIEGRLKSPEYVAAICQVYRKALDLAGERTRDPLSARDHYKLEMTFSRGLFSGWMHGVNHQRLVLGTYSNKRGPIVGRIRQVGPDYVEAEELSVEVRPGDGLLLDDGRDQNRQQGGRLYEIRGRRLYFQHRKIDFQRLAPGMLIYKTDDPQLDAALKKSFQRPLEAPRIPVDWLVEGQCGEPLRLVARAYGHEIQVTSEIPLQLADRAPLTSEQLRAQLGRLGETPYALGNLDNRLLGQVILPIKELNRLRRLAIERLQELPPPADQPRPIRAGALSELWPVVPPPDSDSASVLIPLCRNLPQLVAMLEQGVPQVYVDFEDIRRYPEAVRTVRAQGGTRIFLATPRIQKASETGFFKLIESAEPDGVLIRNLGALAYFQRSKLPCIGDFSLNAANPLTTQILHREGLERVTVSYDLNVEQVLALVRATPPAWLEIVLHQHMPMFHMEHCVFAAFLSEGKDFLTCGRPCDRHQVSLRDRVGVEHPVLADVGCRNTVYHGRAQTGVSFWQQFQEAGVRHYRLEFLQEGPEQARTLYQEYQSVLEKRLAPAELVRRLNLVSQLGVTSGTLTVLSH